MTLNEIRQRRAAQWDACKKFMDAHTDANGLMSAEDAANYDQMEKDLDMYTAQIERLERAQNIDNAMNAAMSKPLHGSMINGEHKTGRASDEYERAFWDTMRSKHGMMTAEIRNALEVGTASEGGYLVPTEFERTLVDALADVNVMRQLATVITTAGERKIPVVASHGTANWIDEEAAYPDSDDAFGQVSLGAHKLATSIKVSEELMQDSAFDMQTYIAREFARRIGAKEEEGFLTGNGTGKPLGLLAATGGAQTGVTAAGQNAITLDEIMDLYFSLREPYRGRATWLMNDATVKALRKIKDSNGQYIWAPAVTAGNPDMLLNRPVRTSAQMPVMAAGAKTVLFGDMSYFWIADRSARNFKRLDELYAANGQVGFLASERVDGKLTLGEAVKVLVQQA